MRKSKPSITGFFPFLNDWGTIGSLVLTLDQTLKEVAKKYEIIIVDDGSDKRSKEVLQDLKKKFPKLRIVTHDQNRGYGAAIKSGISEAKMELIFYTDGDAQYDPRDLKKLVSAMQPNIDVVNGYKIKRADPWYRIAAGKTYHYVVKMLFNIPIRDTDCDFRLMRRKIFKTVKLESNSGLICVEMIKKIDEAGFKFSEVGVQHYWRTSGKSQFFNFKRVGTVVLGLLGLWYKLVIRTEKLEQICRIHTSELKGSSFARYPLPVYLYLKHFCPTVVITTSENDKIVGFVLAYTKSAWPQLLHLRFTGPELQFIAVDKKYQGQGYGKKLVGSLEEEYKKMGIQKYWVGTKKNDQKSNAFYKHLKFELAGQANVLSEQQNFYSKTIN